MIRVRINLVEHTQCRNMTSMTQRQESLIRAKPGHRIQMALEKLKMAFSSRPPPRRAILKDLENKCIAATKPHWGVYKDTLHQPQNTNSLRTRETIPRTWSSNVSLLSNSTPRVSRWRLAQMETIDKTKTPRRGLTALDLITAKTLILLGFSAMHQWLYHSWILAKAATAGQSTGLRTTASIVEASA